jgi:cobalt-zinc-cadmium efflux system protein
VATFVFGIAEAVVGWRSGSLALLSDAGHMLSDTLALGLAAVAGFLALQPPSARHTYGLVRAEVIAASVNGVLMLVVIVAIAYEAIIRLAHPAPVDAYPVMLIGVLGLALNGGLAFLLSHGEATLNRRAALIHVVGDALGSAAAVVAGGVILLTGWLPIDPLLSLLVAGLILSSTLSVLWDALHVLMEAVPKGLDLQHIGADMARLSGVRSVHDLHIWTLASGKTALSAHMELADLAAWPHVLDTARGMLRESYDIDHVTLQPELPVAATHIVHAVIPVRDKK